LQTVIITVDPLWKSSGHSREQSQGLKVMMKVESRVAAYADNRSINVAKRKKQHKMHQMESQEMVPSIESSGGFLHLPFDIRHMIYTTADGASLKLFHQLCKQTREETENIGLDSHIYALDACYIFERDFPSMNRCIPVRNIDPDKAKHIRYIAYKFRAESRVVLDTENFHQMYCCKLIHLKPLFPNLKVVYLIRRADRNDFDSPRIEQQVRINWSKLGPDDMFTIMKVSLTKSIWTEIQKQVLPMPEVQGTVNLFTQYFYHMHHGLDSKAHRKFANNIRCILRERLVNQEEHLVIWDELAGYFEWNAQLYTKMGMRVVPIENPVNFLPSPTKVIQLLLDGHGYKNLLGTSFHEPKYAINKDGVWKIKSRAGRPNNKAIIVKTKGTANNNIK
jgi:hypothetical protein